MMYILFLPLIKEVSLFLKTGRVKKLSIRDTRYFTNIFLICILCLCTIILSLLFVVIFTLIFDIKIPVNQTNEQLSNKSIGYVFIVTVIIIPVCEELLFRLSLKYSVTSFSIMGALLFYFINVNFSSYLNGQTFLQILLSILFGGVIFGILSFFQHINDVIVNFWGNNPKIILYTSIFSFGFIHIINFAPHINSQVLFILPLITLPQTVAGVFLGFTRLKYGICVPILLHSLNNGMSFMRHIF